MKRFFYPLALTVCLLPVFANAANYYVRADATGANNGSDWTNAYKVLPSKLNRGDTYYVADGSYAARTFADPVSGTTPITIKKATAADHGTSTGWSNAYGDGQAVFGNFTFQTSNYVIDGQTRNESNWFDAASYGFSVGSSSSQQQISIKNYGKAPNNITIKYAYVPGWSAALPSSTQRIYAIDIDDYDGGSVSTGLVFSRMFVSKSNNVWFLRTTNGAVVEYSATDGTMNNSANHGEIVNLYYSGNNAVIRYNKFRNAYTDAGGGGTALVAITQANGLQFYGNVAWNFNSSDAAVGFNGYSSSNNRIYNNTFINGVGYNSGMRFGSGTNNTVYNNLFVNCKTVAIEGSHDYNAFSDGNNRGEANAQLNVPSSIFVNYSGNDFRLGSDTAAGKAMTSPFNLDMLGATRGEDGRFSRGAYEFVAAPASVSPPTNLQVN
jgi:hypothetical protein